MSALSDSPFFHGDLLRVHGWNKFVLLRYVELMCFLIPFAYGIKYFYYSLVLVTSFSAIFRSRIGIPYVFQSLISKFSRWLQERVPNAPVGLLTLRLASPGWVSMLLSGFLSAILTVAMPPKGWQPVPRCISASVACRPGGPSKLLSHSIVDTDLCSESYIELNRLSRFAKSFTEGANS